MWQREEVTQWSAWRGQEDSQQVDGGGQIDWIRSQKIGRWSQFSKRTIE